MIPCSFRVSSSYAFVIVLNMHSSVAKLTYCAFNIYFKLLLWVSKAVYLHYSLNHIFSLFLMTSVTSKNDQDKAIERLRGSQFVQYSKLVQVKYRVQ